MDVTDRDKPKLRWVINGGVGDYAELGQTWSTVNIERIKTGSDPTTFKTVLIFGGGYDTAQDSKSVRGVDVVGRSMYIVDADTGKMIWRAGPTGSLPAPDLVLDDMQYSMPARIKPLDFDGDGFVDRLYAGDMGGQLWRIDIDSDSSTSTSVSAKGGRIADLAVDASAIDNRRFYYPPDVALIVQEGQAPFISIVAGSGYRAHPLNITIHDRMYMIRDYDVFNVPSPYTTITEADLFDTTDNAIGEGDQTAKDAATASLDGSEGWFISLEELDGSFVGEKALAEPLILNGVAIMTTFLPATSGINLDECKPNVGAGSIFFVNVADGTPTFDLSGTTDKTREDRNKFLARGGIPPSPTIIITDAGTPTLCVGTECGQAGAIGTLQKMYWYEK
jgi:type IV pilus assembly protein PilY1